MPTPEPSALQPGSAAERPVFDAGVLGAMFNDDAGLIAALLQTFVASTSTSLVEISRAIAAQDLSTVAALAHRVAGASRLSGAQTFGDMAANLESAAKRDDLHAVQAALPDLADLWHRVQQAMGPQPA